MNTAGEIDVMPEIHIEHMLKVVTRGMRSFSNIGESNPNILNHIGICEHDITLVIHRYIHLTQSRRAAAKKYYSIKSVRQVRTEPDIMDT